ncbi:MAG: hypothetical protein ABW195_04030 [Ilumatobacteraceae bacterium]
MADPFDELELARQSLGISVSDLWLRYFALGGMYTALEVDATLFGALHPDDHDRDMLAAALNECSLAAGGRHPIPYSGDELADR